MREITIEDLNLLEIGNGLQLQGFLLGDANTTIAITLPNEDISIDNPYLLRANQEQYKAIIRQMDLQEVEMTNDKNAKIIVRKSQRKADTFITWAVFRRDNYTCRYCGRNDVPLTYDHVKLWKDKGEWSMENGVTACRKCNKTRGDMDFALWLNSAYVQGMLSNVPEDLIKMNVETMNNYLTFPDRTSKRSR